MYFLSCVCYAFVITCWERANLLTLVCGDHFPIGILGQVWYWIKSIPDLCTLTYFKMNHGQEDCLLKVIIFGCHR